VALEELSNRFCRKREATRPIYAPSGLHQEQHFDNEHEKSLAVWSEATNFVEKRRPRGPWPPSGLHQEQHFDSEHEESVAVTKRPSGNRTAFSFKGE